MKNEGETERAQVVVLEPTGVVVVGPRAAAGAVGRTSERRTFKCFFFKAKAQWSICAAAAPCASLTRLLPHSLQ